jgi:hypothetical protein
MQGDRKRAVDAVDAHRRLIREQSPVSARGDRRRDCLFRTAQVREAISVLGQLSHDLLAAGRSSPGARVEARFSLSDPAVNRRPGIALATLEARTSAAEWPANMLPVDRA